MITEIKGEILFGSYAAAATAAKSLSRVQLFATLWSSPPGSSVHGIFQARVLEWGAIAFSGILC